MRTPDQQLVCAWIDAYYSHRDGELLALAHPDIEIRPRAGQGQRLYTGLEGTRRWLADTAENRLRILEFSTGVLPDGRVLAEATLDDLPVCGVFAFREHLIAAVSMYVSDREMLQRVQTIVGEPSAVARQMVSAPPDAP